jgi:hypothetical protein
VAPCATESAAVTARIEWTLSERARGFELRSLWAGLCAGFAGSAISTGRLRLGPCETDAPTSSLHRYFHPVGVVSGGYTELRINAPESPGTFFCAGVEGWDEHDVGGLLESYYCTPNPVMADNVKDQHWVLY